MQLLSRCIEQHSVGVCDGVMRNEFNYFVGTCLTVLMFLVLPSRQIITYTIVSQKMLGWKFWRTLLTLSVNDIQGP